jgi:DNA segregation ATPase FtsK/SpoIIIE-like protein
LKVGDHYKSKIILDQTGAETLLGKGDGLVKIPSQVEIIHVQVPYQSDTELTETIKECESLLQYRIDGMASTTTADGENDGKNGFWQLLRIALAPFLQHPFKCLFKAWGIAFAVVALGIMFGL